MFLWYHKRFAHATAIPQPLAAADSVAGYLSTRRRAPRRVFHCRRVPHPVPCCRWSARQHHRSAQLHTLLAACVLRSAARSHALLPSSPGRPSLPLTCMRYRLPPARPWSSARPDACAPHLRASLAHLIAARAPCPRTIRSATHVTCPCAIQALALPSASSPARSTRTTRKPRAPIRSSARSTRVPAFLAPTQPKHEHPLATSPLPPLSRARA